MRKLNNYKLKYKFKIVNNIYIYTIIFILNIYYLFILEFK